MKALIREIRLSIVDELLWWAILICPKDSLKTLARKIIEYWEESIHA